MNFEEKRKERNGSVRNCEETVEKVKAVDADMSFLHLCTDLLSDVHRYMYLKHIHVSVYRSIKCIRPSWGVSMR